MMLPETTLESYEYMKIVNPEYVLYNDLFDVPDNEGTFYNFPLEN